MKNFGCAIMILPAVAFILFMVKYNDISPVAGTTMWIVFFLGLWMNSIGRKEEEEEEGQRTKASTTPKPIPDPALKPTPTATHDPMPRPPVELTPKPTSKPEIFPLPSLQQHPVGKINYVNYTSSIPDQIDVFPIYRCPKHGCVVRTHSLGRINRRGFKEEDFQSAIKECFGNEFTVSGGVILNTGKQTRPFEPDIALIDNSNPSLKIDIEIDEPYAGFTRKPTHCKGDDTQRDIYFSDRGWIVLRFSEFQVHTKEKQCLTYIARIIQSVKPSFQIPSELEEYGAVGKQQLWDLLTAQKWEKAQEREKYLNYTFGELIEDPIVIENGFGEQDSLEESKVKPTPIGTRDNRRAEGFNLPSKRDNRIDFYPESHVYTIDKVPAPSVSTIVSMFFPEFDAYRAARNLNPNHEYHGRDVQEIVELWENRGIDSANKGTLLHEQIEKFYLKTEYDRPEEFQLFEQFHSDHLHIEPYRSEWRIFDEDYHIAGTIDMVAKNGNQFEIYDWKRSKKVVNGIGKPITENHYQQGISFLKDLDNTSYNRYCLQQSLYRYILESKYDLSISNMYLVVLHPNYDRYYKIEVPYMRDEVQYMLKAL